MTPECSGHGVRCALNCRRGGRRHGGGALGRGDDGKRPGGGARLEEFGLTGALPAEIGQLTSLRELGPQRQSADERAGGDRAAQVAEGLYLADNRLTSVPAEIGQLTSLELLASTAIS